MAKDRTLQAIQSAVESGTLKAGASKLLNTYTPIRTNLRVSPGAAASLVKMDGAKNGQVTLIAQEGAFWEENYYFFAEYTKDGNVISDNPIVTIEDTNDEIVANFEELEGGVGNVLIVSLIDNDGDVEETLDGVKISVNDVELEAPAESVEVSYRERKLVIEPLEGYEFVSLYVEQPAEGYEVEYKDNKIPMDRGIWTGGKPLFVMCRKIN